MEAMRVQARVERLGNSLIFRIPQEVIDQGELTQDCVITLEFQGNFAKATPSKIPHYELEDLLAGMTPDQVHPEIDTGPPVGKEIW
jgi:antitoxin MazE